MEAKLEKGRALILVGPPGCGKTTAARALAEAEGEFREIALHELGKSFQNWMDGLVKTVIVDGFPTSRALLDRVMHYVAADQIEVNRKMEPVELMTPPNFIFCTCSSELLKSVDSRRFRVVRIGSGC